MPARMGVVVPKGFTGKLAVYVDAMGMKLLGPAGWTCGASYGSDNEAVLAVGPPGWSASATTEQLNVIWQGTCVTCTVRQACSLFRSAAARYFHDHPRSKCPATRPPAERVMRLAPDLVAFEDPPYVKGDGIPSGGPYADNGIMTYFAKSATGPQSRLVDCVLPAKDHQMCTAALDQFIAWSGHRLPASS